MFQMWEIDLLTSDRETSKAYIICLVGTAERKWVYNDLTNSGREDQA
jgi:hypothetical protein